MSHIGKKPIAIPSGVTVTQEERVVRAKGPKGELTFSVHPAINVQLKDSQLICAQALAGREARALWGTTRARLQNIVQGVHAGFEKKLELHGVGYRAAVKQGNLELQVGFSHPVVVHAPEGITFSVKEEEVTVAGANNETVGQVAATLRAIRPPEPYKGKGIRYVGERVRRKVGKVVGATA